MTNEELAILAQQGDKEASEQLMIQNKKFVYHFVKKYFGTRNFEEKIQLAYLGMIRAIKNYNPEKGKFVTWAGWYMRGSITNELRKSQISTTSLYESVYNDGEKVRRIDVIPGPETENDLAILVEQLLINETERNKSIFYMYLDGVTQTAIGEHYHISQAQVWRLINRMANKFKEVYEVS